MLCRQDVEHPASTKCQSPSQVTVTTQSTYTPSQSPCGGGGGVTQGEKNSLYSWGIWGGQEQGGAGFRRAELKSYL